MKKFFVFSALILCSLSFDADVFASDSKSLVEEIVSIGTKNKVGQKKRTRKIRVDQSYCGADLKPFEEVLILLSTLEVPTVRMLSLHQKDEESVYSIRQLSDQYGIEKNYLPISVVEGDTFDYLDVKNGVVKRLSLIPGFQGAGGSTQLYESWDSLPHWFMSLLEYR